MEGEGDRTSKGGGKGEVVRASKGIRGIEDCGEWTLGIA
jgi:hypothetical protein